MDASSNMFTVETSDSGPAPGTILRKCKDAQNGVSVRNVYTRKQGYRWFVFRADHGREDKAYSMLQRLGAECYRPRHTVYQRTPAGVKSTVKNLMPYFVLAYLTDWQARLYTRGGGIEFYARTEADKSDILLLNQLLSFYYDHTRRDLRDDTKNPPLVVPDDAMDQFITATLTEKDVMPVSHLLDFKVGDEVEVIMGEFKGLTGRVINKPNRKNRLRVQLNNPATATPGGAAETPVSATRQRLFFHIPCLGSFSSALIPVHYFRRKE